MSSISCVFTLNVAAEVSNPTIFDFSSDEQILVMDGNGTAITDGALKLNVPYGNNSGRAKLNYILEEGKTYRVSFDSDVTYLEGSENGATVFTLNTASADSTAWTMFYSNYVKTEDNTVTYDAHERKEYSPNTILYSMSATNSTTKSHYEFEFTVDYLPEDHKYLGILFQSSKGSTYVTVDNLIITEINGGTVNFEADVDGVIYDSITGYNG